MFNKITGFMERNFPFYGATALCLFSVFEDDHQTSVLLLIAAGVWYACGLLQEKVN